MKHLIIFTIIIIGVVFLTGISWYDNFINQKLCLTANPNVYLDKLNNGSTFARGMFANKNFNFNEIIEQAPYIEDLTDNFTGSIKNLILKKNQTNSVIGFGNISLYNRTNTPNASWNITDEYVEIKALKPIGKNTEILIGYENNKFENQ
jgi:hypothetical protein